MIERANVTADNFHDRLNEYVLNPVNTTSQVNYKEYCEGVPFRNLHAGGIMDMY